MLSAVAARKARLAQSQLQCPPSAVPPKSFTPAPSPATEPREEPHSSSSRELPSKRKPSTTTGRTAKRRKNQHRRPSPDRNVRYFAQPDACKTQDDMILVDDTDSESSDVSHSSQSESEAPLMQMSRPETGPTRQKRVWSPSAPLPDSSDDENSYSDNDPVVLDVPQPFSVAKAPTESDSPSTLSTFRPALNQNIFHLRSSEVSDRRSTLKRTALLLKASDSLALLGTYSITVLRGVVTLAGVPLTASPISYPVFAPRSSPIPTIRCLPPRSSSPQPPESTALPAQIAAVAEGHDAVVILQELQTGVEALGRVCRTFDGFFAPSRWHRDQSRFDIGLDTVYFLAHQTPDVCPLEIPPTWDVALTKALPKTFDENESAAQRHIYLVRGPKNAGKSTFARLTMNRLLSKFRRVAYLECDLGQAEFTLGGMVSLNIVDQPTFGPPFSHPSIPHAAHYVGATSPKSSPSHYLESIQALIQDYNSVIQISAVENEDDEGVVNPGDDRINSVIPLVVNTMGWTKGLGADLARKVEEIVEPAQIFSFGPSSGDDEWITPGQRYPIPAPTISGSPLVYSVESIPQTNVSLRYSAADHRNLALLSYFHAVFPARSTVTSPIATEWNVSLPLCAQPPYEIDSRTAFDKLVLTGAGMEDVVPSEVHRTINGSVVGLVRCEPESLEFDVDGDTESPLIYEQGAAPPSPHLSRCIGLALVRAISSHPFSRIQLLTPVPSHLLGLARVLVMGELQMPVWGMLDFRTLDDGGDIAGYERGKVPYLRWGKGEGAGGERRRVRRNLMRRGQM